MRGRALVDSPNYNKLKELLDMPRQPLGGEDRTENAQVGNAHSKVDSAHSNAQAFVSDKNRGHIADPNGCERLDVLLHLRRQYAPRKH